MSCRRAVGLAGLLVAACGPSSGVDDVAEIVLAAPADTVLTPFGQVPLAAPMGEDRWLVVAPDWDQAVVADFGTRGTTPLGARPGRDYQRPVHVFAAGDSLYLADWGMRRLTVWDRSGRLARSAPPPEALRGIFPAARDGAGRFYFEVPLSGGPEGRGLLDSAPVLRSDAGMERFDTVAWLGPPDVLEVIREGRSRLERTVFGGRDRWGVMPDGSLWVARVERSRVEWTEPGGTTRRGPSLPDPVYEVTEFDREAFYAQFPPDLRSSAEGLPFALVKPPFEGAFTGPDRRIWLEKSRAGADSVRRVHVVGADGNLERRLVLPTRGRVIAVGDSTLLIAEQWREGVRLLQARVPGGP